MQEQVARSSLAEKVAVEPFQMDAGAKQRKVKRRVRAKEVVMPLTLLLNANDANFELRYDFFYLNFINKKHICFHPLRIGIVFCKITSTKMELKQ